MTQIDSKTRRLEKRVRSLEKRLATVERYLLGTIGILLFLIWGLTLIRATLR